MRWNSPSSLGKTVEAKATNRPVKVAYLVPFDDTPHTHMNLDAVFFESYTRWAGVYTLVIPTRTQEFLTDGYDKWLERYDPDFIYSYVDIDTAFIDNIDHLCCPIAFLKHENQNRDESEIDWRTFLPNWGTYIQPVSSISTVSSPASFPRFFHEERPLEPTVFTQYGMAPSNRFLADNFGTGFDLHMVTNPIPGFFKTLCLVPDDLAENVVAGTVRCFTPLEAFRAISDSKATPISHLAMVNSAGIPRPESRDWAFAFRLFIGSTPLDRIHFWNSRHLGSSWNHTSNALILEPAFFDDEQLTEQLGQYLNKNNFLGHGSGTYKAKIHSSSVAEDVLNTIKDKLQTHTLNTVHVSRSFNAPAIPTQKDLVERTRGKSADATTLKLTEDFSEIIASEPAHFIYISPQLRRLVRGQWIVELSIQRHEDLSKYSNVVDTWTLPRRRKITHAFTDRLAKPTLTGQLAIVPSTKAFPFRSQSIKDPCFYEIHLPSDETFFRHLTSEHFRYPSDDLREPIPREGYVDLAVSDKGQNLRGVISLFGHLSTAYGILTKKFWRDVLKEAKEESTKPLTFNWDKLHSLIPNDQGTIQRLTQELGFDNSGITKEYLRDSLTDTLEHLVRINVFYQVAHWRCEYCGHMNSRSFDKMKIKNECDICTTAYFAPIDIEWKYELNDFVYRSLQKHSGLSVLWTLGYLQDQLFSGSYWYLPEVDFYDNEDDPESKNEIDILCMLNGAFCAVEAKKSASTFLNQAGAIDKFLKVIGRLRPDVALLAFERFCRDEGDVQTTEERLNEAAANMRERIGPWTRLEILVAQNIIGFNEFSADLGLSYGPRVSKRKYH